MSNSLRIAIAGKAGSGKSTAAKWLEETYGFTRFALAGKLKELCSLHSSPDRWDEVRRHVDDLLPSASISVRDSIESGVLDTFSTTPVVNGKNRGLLQCVGTDVVRSYADTAWVDYFLRITEDEDRAVVDDVRFANEFEALKSNGWKLVLCDLPLDVRQSRIAAEYGRPLTTEELTHPSEKDMDEVPREEWDWIIDTSGTVAEEWLEVGKMMLIFLEEV